MQNNSLRPMTKFLGINKKKTLGWRNQPLHAKIWLVLLFFIAWAAGAAALYYGVQGLIREQSAKSWSTTVGVVKEAWVQKSSSSRGPTFWCPTWRYVFRGSDGKGYSSTKSHFGTKSCEKTHELAETKLSAHPVNSRVSVIINPDVPYDSALYISDSKGHFWWFLIIAGMVFLGIASSVPWMYSQTRKNHDGV